MKQRVNHWVIEYTHHGMLSRDGMGLAGPGMHLRRAL